MDKKIFELAQEALEDFTEAITLNPNNVENYYLRGNINYDLGHYQAAFQDFTKAININPDLSIADYYRDLALDELKRSR
ncbi:tetratricopeptide repeat protein [Chroococcus sp. FPU101]|uniref:tetratricopeptide repeat protein n=1 Tax=Chroococcus sp. FPU101 TaxID=1974212 RepID=UPI001A8D9092|nr:tetratricopeptide repeat protein [Chroococcus sp. FPU101]GFE70081.1 hypothetical protein CFPU101_26910 [Chroococcus sp. FPU101]